jgi:hypothetical protein
LDLHNPAATAPEEAGGGNTIETGASENPPGDETLGRRNPAIYESDLLTFTTDVRMDKVSQILSNSDRAAGGDIEVAFWIKDVMNQWRVKGKAFIIGGDSADRVEMKAREEIWKWMRRREPGAESAASRGAERAWSWEREITAHFANLSPIMRGGFPFRKKVVLLYSISVRFVLYAPSPCLIDDTYITAYLFLFKMNHSHSLFQCRLLFMPCKSN